MKFAKWLGLGFLALLVLLFLCFVFRNTILHKLFDRYCQKLKTEKHLSLSVSNLHFAGLRKVALNNIVLLPENADTLLSIQNAELTLSLAALYTGKVTFAETHAQNVWLNLYNQPERNNLHFLKSSSANAESEEASP